MTFDHLADIYQRHLDADATDEPQDARATLAEWLEDSGGKDAVISRDVRIILAAADFGREITTTVLWLNDVYGTDVRCVRLSPYRLGDRLLLDVQPVIPLPEAEELTIQLRRRETVARAAASGRDWTLYVITSPTSATQPLRKRRAVLAMVQALSAAGVTCEAMRQAIRGPRFLAVDGVLSDDYLTDAFIARYPRAEKQTGRWFLDEPVHQHNQTWILSKMWGTDTETALTALAPASGIGYRPA